MSPREMREPRPGEEARPSADGRLKTSAPAFYDGDRSPLRQALDDAIAESNGSKLSMKDLTVLSDPVDPFRMDTPANHKIGKWLADTAATQGLAPRPLLDSSWSFVEQCKELIDSKAYRIGGAS